MTDYDILKGKKIIISPDYLVKTISSVFNPLQQHDSHEFFTFVLTRLEEEETPTEKRFVWEHNIGMKASYAYRLYMSAHPSIVDQLFTGKFLI